MLTEMNEQMIEERRKKTKLVLSNIYNLPAMSGVMMEVSKLLDDPTTGTNALSTMIGRDQGLATKILSISNSPLYGLPRRVSTIDFAILIIGYQDIKNIVIALSMIESFKNKNDKNLNQREFWLHSVMTGNAGKRIADDMGYKFGGEAFVAGLLHDLGIPVMHKYFHSAFNAILEKVEKDGMSFLDAEYEQLGYNHQEIGKFLGEKWNLPSHLCESVLNHHTPGKAKENKEMTAVVHLADYMTQYLEIGAFYWDDNYKLSEDVFDILKFKDLDELHSFVEQYRELFTKELENTKL